MAGASIPQGFFGGGMTGGSSIGWSGGQGLGGTTAAVANPTDSSKLQAYDASTMATSLTPRAPLPEALGLAEGSVGAAGMTGDMQQSAAGTLYKPPTPVIPPVVKKAATTKLPATAGKPAAAAAAPAKPALQQVGGQGYGQQPLYVNDQWNSQGGTSMPVATPALGAVGQGQAPFWTDGKGNYFFDAQGTKPVTGGAATQLKNQFGMFR